MAIGSIGLNRVHLKHIGQYFPMATANFYTKPVPCVIPIVPNNFARLRASGIIYLDQFMQEQNRWKMTELSLFNDRKKILSTDIRAFIQIRAYDQATQKYKYLSTGIKIEPKEWDNKNKGVSGKYQQYHRLNSIIKNKVKELEDYEPDITLEGEHCTLDILEQFNTNGRTSLTFNEFVDHQLKGSSLKVSTIRQQRVTLKKLNKFNESMSFA